MQTEIKVAVAAAALAAKMKGIGGCDWVQISLNLISISLRTFYYFRIIKLFRRGAGRISRCRNHFIDHKTDIVGL